MIYSVFDWEQGQYNYYKGLGDTPGNRPKPVRVINKPKSKNGVQLESVLPAVPSGAQHVGSGKVPKGRIAVLSGNRFGGFGSINSDFDTSYVESKNPIISRPWTTLGLFIGFLYLGSKVAFAFGKSAEANIKKRR